MGKSVVLDGAPDRRRYRSRKLVVREINCRPGPDIGGRHLFNKEKGRHAMRRAIHGPGGAALAT